MNLTFKHPFQAHPERCLHLSSCGRPFCIHTLSSWGEVEWCTGVTPTHHSCTKIENYPQNSRYDIDTVIACDTHCINHLTKSNKILLITWLYRRMNTIIICPVEAMATSDCSLTKSNLSDFVPVQTLPNIIKYNVS